MTGTYTGLAVLIDRGFKVWLVAGQPFSYLITKCGVAENFEWKRAESEE